MTAAGTSLHQITPWIWIYLAHKKRSGIFDAGAFFNPWRKVSRLLSELAWETASLPLRFIVESVLADRNSVLRPKRE